MQNHNRQEKWCKRKCQNNIDWIWLSPLWLLHLELYTRNGFTRETIHGYVYNKNLKCMLFVKYIIIWARCMGEPFWLGLLVCWGLLQFNINVSHSTIFFLTNIKETVHISSLMNISRLHVFENKERENYMLWSYMNIKKTYLT